MLKAGNVLREGFYTELLHVSCLCHCLSLVCLEIQAHYSRASDLVSAFKLVFQKTKLKLLIEARSVTNMPQWPISTRWGTWVRMASYILGIYEQLTSLMSIISAEDTPFWILLNDNMNRNDAYRELQEVGKLSFICDAITTLETRGLTRFQQRDIINDTKQRLPSIFQVKLNTSLAKNPDIETLFEDRFPVSARSCMNYYYAPLTNCDIVRSFSTLKYVLTYHRTNFT